MLGLVEGDEPEAGSGRRIIGLDSTYRMASFYVLLLFVFFFFFFFHLCRMQGAVTDPLVGKMISSYRSLLRFWGIRGS